MAKRSTRIPVMRPLLPTANKILPYLEEIDTNRWYSNLGPLTMRLEERLAELFHVSHTSLITLSNGTAALSVILRAMNVPFGSFCLIPSWTFVATAAAATEVGMLPFFLDVKEDSWALDPDEVKAQLKYIPGKIGAVMVVSPFGEPIPVAAWDAFTEETGIPVIIDAAAGFDSVLQYKECREGKTPVMVSMHATKTFGIGEGAFLICQDKQLVHCVRQMSNFGFTASREVVIAGVNAKLNEYNAAVGLAALDDWPEKRAKWAKVTDTYLQALSEKKHPRISHRLSSEWVTSVCNVMIPMNLADTVIEQLALAGIESRKWWVKGCHLQTAYKQCQHFATPVTDALANRVIALPFSVDMAEADVHYVVGELVATL